MEHFFFTDSGPTIDDFFDCSDSNLKSPDPVNNPFKTLKMSQEGKPSDENMTEIKVITAINDPDSEEDEENTLSDPDEDHGQ